jgi:hypothetical protein
MDVRLKIAAIVAMAAMGLAAACGGDDNNQGTGNDGDAGSDAAPATDGGHHDATSHPPDAPSAFDTGSGVDSAQPGVDSGGGVDAGGTNDAGTDSPAIVDAGPDVWDGAFVEAPHPRMPILVDQSGPVNAAPVITEVTFSSTYTNNVSDLDAFMTGLWALPYWSAATSEYGVAAPTVKNAQHLAEAAPGNTTDAAIKTWLANKIQTGATGFTNASNNSLFVLFYPSTTTISKGAGSKSCQAFGGYHGSTTVTVGGNTIYPTYAVIPECVASVDAGGAQATLDETTAAASHEMVEAVTDPYVDRQTTPISAWVGTTTFASSVDPYAAWPYGIVGSYGLLEDGDMCESFGSSFFTPTGFAYMVQRTWSNAAVRAGKDPCAPYHTGETAYFLAQPVFDPNFAADEAMSPPVYLPQVSFAGGSGTTQGVSIAVGSSATVPLILWSDAPVAAPWTVTARDVSDPTGATTYLTLALDKSTGNNGDTIHLTITVNSADTNIGGEAFVVTSTDGVLRHSTYGYVGN